MDNLDVDNNYSVVNQDSSETLENSIHTEDAQCSSNIL